MQPYIRFQTNLRCRYDGCRLGIFCAEREYETSLDLPDYIRDELEKSYQWFNENLRVPRLSDKHWRALFWFRTSAQQLLTNVWPIVALLNDAGIVVETLTSFDPGSIVYQDHHQIAAIPKRGRRYLQTR